MKLSPSQLYIYLAHTANYRLNYFMSVFHVWKLTTIENTM